MLDVTQREATTSKDMRKDQTVSTTTCPSYNQYTLSVIFHQARAKF